MTNKDTTSTNKASVEGQQHRNDNVTGAAATGPSSPNPTAPITNQVINVGRGSSVTPPGSNRASPSFQGSPSGRGSSTPRRDSPSGRGSHSVRGSPGRKSPPSGSGRGPSSSPSLGAGQTNHIGGRKFAPASVEISLGGGSMGSMVPTGGSPQQRVKRKAEMIAPEGVIPICSVCKRSNFCSWKALFGHMRCHPERQWRGCFPPPGFEEAQQALQQEEGGGALRGFDLNESDPKEENEGRSGGGGSGFDLNMPPADDNNDDNNDGDGGGSTGVAETN